MSNVNPARAMVNNNVQSSQTSNSDSISVNVSALNASNGQNKANIFAILSTTVINVFDRNGNEIQCRALLDSGSQSNFIRRGLLERLKLSSDSINLPVTGIGNATTLISDKSEVTVASRYNGYKRKLPFLIINRITGEIPTRTFNVISIHLPEGLLLADNNFNKTHPIDMLLGAGIFYELLCVGQITLGKGKPILQKTRLGWVVSGEINANNLNTSQCNISIEDRIEKCWHIEEVDNSSVSE